MDRDPLADDPETAPLLRDPESDDAEEEQPSTFMGKINSIAHEPLTPLSKVLLIVALVLLLLTSIFIGLFAGISHKYNSERGNHGGDDGKQPPPETITATTTSYTTTTVHFPAPTSPPKEPEELVCLTPQCIMLSASILSSLDTTQDPCENFYQYVNGQWLASHPLPADKGSFGQFESLADENKQVIRRILESSESTSSFSTSYDEQLLRKLRDFYSSCTDEIHLDAIGISPLKQFVDTLRDLYRGKSIDITGTLASNSKEKGLTTALAFLHSRAIDGLFSLDIEGDVGVDPNHMVLWFSQPSLGLPSKEYYEEESIRTVYQNTLEKLLFLLAEEGPPDVVSGSDALVVQEEGEDNVWPPWPWPPWGGDDDDDDDKKPVNQSERARKLAKKVVKFETDIANASLDLDVLWQDPFGTYNPLPVSNLTDSLPQIYFSDYFSTFNPRAFPEKVVMTYPSYAASLSAILKEAPSDVIEAYLVTRAALAISPYLGTGTEAWQAQRTLVELLSGIKKGAVGDRSEYCIARVEDTLGFAAGRYFVNETFGGESRKRGTKVITDIIDSFSKSLSHIEWMDKESAQAAEDKARAIRVKVGFPISPDTRDAASIARYYSLVKIRDHDFVGNILSAAVSDQTKAWLQLGKARDLESWEMNPSTVNAYFNPPANEIVFPAGILQPPFFSKDWPNYLSYGSFGHVAAHELTHAFDSSGRLYNQNGKLEEWWTKNTSDGFNVKQECIVNQYSGYSIDDGKGGKVHVNGNLTSGENIGDTGLIQAYRAWKSQYSDSLNAGTEYQLPGMNYTKEQLFFISFGRIWARSMKPAAALQRIRTDPHSPNPFRVDGTVYNIPEFARAFSCSKDAKLNPPPEKQCIFW